MREFREIREKSGICMLPMSYQGKVKKFNYSREYQRNIKEIV